MLIILDRDGVINHERVDFVKSPEEWEPIPQSLAAIAKLNQANHTIVIATNQSGVARGLFDVRMLAQIHEKMLNCLANVNAYIHGIYYCPHHPQAHCFCRKPNPGLFLQIAKDFNINLSREAVAIGDSWRDLQAAQAVQCPTLLVKTGNGLKTLAEHDLGSIPVFKDLYTAVHNGLKL